MLWLSFNLCESDSFVGKSHRSSLKLLLCLKGKIVCGKIKLRWFVPSEILSSALPWNLFLEFAPSNHVSAEKEHLFQHSSFWNKIALPLWKILIFCPYHLIMQPFFELLWFLNFYSCLFLFLKIFSIIPICSGKNPNSFLMRFLVSWIFLRRKRMSFLFTGCAADSKAGGLCTVEACQARLLWESHIRVKQLIVLRSKSHRPFVED